MNRIFRSLAIGMGCAVCLAGCSKYGASVSGVVTLDGQPLPRGNVVFLPVENGPISSGPINERGEYEIWTGREKSLTPGRYDVTVTAHEVPDMSKVESGPPPIPPRLTPAKYSRRQESGLNFEVTSGSNEINIELQSNPNETKSRR